MTLFLARLVVYNVMEDCLQQEREEEMPTIQIEAQLSSAELLRAAEQLKPP